MYIMTYTGFMINSGKDYELGLRWFETPPDFDVVYFVEREVWVVAAGGSYDGELVDDERRHFYRAYRKGEGPNRPALKAPNDPALPPLFLSHGYDRRYKARMEAESFLNVWQKIQTGTFKGY